MSSDYYSIQEIGGAELAQHYPDRGLLSESNWHNAVLHIEPQSEGLVMWLRSISIKSNGFMAVMSANTNGLRILVSLYEFAIFIPWTEAIVSAERAWPATVVRVRTTAVPSLTLVIDLDDSAADDLFGHAVQPLPRRDPPRRLAWWLAEWWVVWIVLAAGISAGLIGALVLLRKV
jgi:hypothetical protein